MIEVDGSSTCCFGTSQNSGELVLRFSESLRNFNGARYIYVGTSWNRVQSNAHQPPHTDPHCFVLRGNNLQFHLQNIHIAFDKLVFPNTIKGPDTDTHWP